MNNNKFLIALAIIVVSVLTNGPIQSTDQVSSVNQHAAESTLLSRIEQYKHAGLSVDERYSGYVLYLFSPEQFSRNIASRAEAIEGRKKLKEKLEFLRQKRKDAQKNNATNIELNAITSKMNSLPRPDLKFLNSIQLHDIALIGTDYIELNPVDQENANILIPIERIRLIVLPKADTPNQK